MTNIQTLDDLKTSKQQDSSDGSDTDQGQAFYAGGSNTSGQQILGPPRNREAGIISEILMQGTEVPRRTAADADNPRSTFSGTGYILGSSAGTSRPINAASSTGRATEVSLKFWKDGFTINDGQLYSYTDPVSQEILRSIRRGEFREEFGDVTTSGEVQLNIEDHRHAAYVRPRASKRAFTGAGCVLGSTASSPATVETENISGQPVDSAESQTAAVTELQLDESQPITSIQIRLEDGTRLIGQFNVTHTIGDIYDFVVRSRPSSVDRPYALFHTFPTFQLSDRNQTIADAGIQNSALIRRVL